MRRYGLALTAAAVGVIGVGQKAWAQVPEGATPLATACEWQLSGGEGQRIPLSNQPGEPGFRVQGTENNTNFWRAQAPLKPGRIYRLDFMYISHSGANEGAVVAGPARVSRNFPCTQEGLQRVGYVFATPRQFKEPVFRLGQQGTNSLIDMCDPFLTEVQGVHAFVDGIELGAGEQIVENTYRFDAPLSSEMSNYGRPLRGFTANFNTDRWVFKKGTQVTYVHRIDNLRQESGRVELNVQAAALRGTLVVEASKDDKTWTEVASIKETGPAAFDLPTSLFPARRVLVRLRGGENARFQVTRYRYIATLAGEPRRLRGETRFVRVRVSGPALTVKVLDTGSARPGQDGLVRVRLTNRTEQSLTCQVGAGSVPRDAEEPAVWTTAPTSVTVPAGESAEVAARLSVGDARELVGHVTVAGDEGKTLFAGSWDFTVPFFYAADYGELLPEANDRIALWWCDATRKISKSRPAPARTGAAVRLSAARNEFEAAQLVVRPSAALSGLKASVSDLAGPGGSKIPADHVQVLRVVYHHVEVPTDARGMVEDWPDALPPLAAPIDVPAGTNQPLWILVKVPATARPGDYKGTVNLSAGDWSAAVPLELHVWNFTLPQEPHIKSAFGLSTGNIARYQGLRSEQEQRTVFDKYLQSFADHRISPYIPTPFDPIEFKFHPEAVPPRAEVSFDRFDPVMQRVMDQYHLTSFMLRVPGTGSGTFHSRKEGELAGFKAGTPQYESMFASMVQQLEEHLRNRGWLDEAYVYWFDEPDPKDYEFVQKVMDRLGSGAPGLRRMLTEEPVEELYGYVDLWCPISHHFDPVIAARRRANGEHFWWYVCTGPKAPYCTLFIDHPATSLRVWLWQTWQNRIEGILVWESTYWTSSAAFPDSLQNPYVDPMAYKSGYDHKPGQKEYWGNGDGRFLYPPLTAAGGSKTPVLDGPVSSIRWEMLRDGIEDVDYLKLLQDAIVANPAKMGREVLGEAEKLLNVPPEITAGMTEYTFDSDPIYSHRRQVAEAIERLTTAPAQP